MMEFDEIVVKESPGLCRCCLSEGCYKDLGTEYTWMNENEVYADMLLECFDISITQHNEGPNGPNRLICEVCITRLRDACNFKKQVLESEKKFIDMVARGEFRPKVLIYQTQMKAEEETNEVPAEDVEYLDEDIDFGEDESQKRVQTSNMSDSVTADPLPVKAKRGRPRKSADVKTVKKMKLVDEKPKTSKAVTKDKRGKDKRSHLSNGKARDKIEIRKFVSAVLELTTIMPFKWFHNRYMCFYCGMTFLDSSKLKEHTKTLHQDVKMKSVLKGIGSYSRIKWDISDLRCKVCPETMESLDEIANHAAKSHDLIINMDVIEKCCYVFRLSDDIMKCTECGETFKFFTPLLCHANKYHNRSKRYLCDLCGKGFAIKGTIISHIQNVHSVIANKCTLCCKTFPTRHSLTNHREIVHKVGKFNCPICSETFKSRYMKKCHLATVHDVKSYQFKCDMCGKVYPDRSKMLRHRSRTHLKEKTVTCHKCGHKAFDMSTLNRHMYSHEDIRPFLCELCEKTFRWKKNLITHMTRHHSL